MTVNKISQKLFLIGIFFIAITIANFPMRSVMVVLSDEFSTCILLGMFVFLCQVIHRKKMLLPYNASFDLFLKFVIYCLLSGILLIPQMAARTYNHQLVLQKFVYYYIFLLIMCMMMIFIYNILHTTPEIYKKITHVFMFGLVLQLVYACIQFLKQIGNTQAINFIALTGPYFGRGIDSMSAYWLKLYGLTEEPSGLANYMVFIFPWLLFAFLQASHSEHHKRIKQGSCFLIFFVMIFVLFFTFSRTAMLSFFLMLFISALIFHSQIMHAFIRKKIQVFISVVAVVSILSIIPSYISSIWDAPVSIDSMVEMTVNSIFSEEGRQSSDSNITRIGGMAASVRIWEDNPIIGCGFGTSRLYMAEYYPDWAKNSSEVVDGLTVVDNISYSYRELTSAVLPRLLAENGALGMMIWLLLWGYMMVHCYKIYPMVDSYKQDILKIIFLMIVAGFILSFNLNYIFSYEYLLFLPIYWDMMDKMADKKPIQ